MQRSAGRCDEVLGDAGRRREVLGGAVRCREVLGSGRHREVLATQGGCGRRGKILGGTRELGGTGRYLDVLEGTV